MTSLGSRFFYIEFLEEETQQTEKDEQDVDNSSMLF